jgi:hypothetical protein
MPKRVPSSDVDWQRVDEAMKPAAPKLAQSGSISAEARDVRRQLADERDRIRVQLSNARVEAGHFIARLVVPAGDFAFRGTMPSQPLTLKHLIVSGVRVSDPRIEGPFSGVDPNGNPVLELLVDGAVTEQTASGLVGSKSVTIQALLGDGRLLSAFGTLD